MKTGGAARTLDDNHLTQVGARAALAGWLWGLKDGETWLS
jgi:hypothetical protein